MVSTESVLLYLDNKYAPLPQKIYCTKRVERLLGKRSCIEKMTARLVNASRWWSFGQQLISGAATNNGMLIKGMVR